MLGNPQIPRTGADDTSQHYFGSSKTSISGRSIDDEEKYGQTGRPELGPRSHSVISTVPLVGQIDLHDEAESSLHGELVWLPFCLRLAYLIPLAALAFSLAIVVLAIMTDSIARNGLGLDDGSTALLFGWRFTPTLVAVIYTIAVTAMLIDVRRTEIFARLAQGKFVPASTTLCLPARSWWNDLGDALSTSKNNGCRSWALFFASIVNILGFLIISPLSAALLAPADLTVAQSAPFQSLRGVQASPFSSDNIDQIAFRTMTGAVLNTTASVWVGSDYFILPFSPRTMDAIPIASSFSTARGPQDWQYNTTAYRADLDCQTLTISALQNTSAYDLGIRSPNATLVGSRSDYQMVTQILSSEDDCTVNVSSLVPQKTSPSSRFNAGGGWWARSAATSDYEFVASTAANSAVSGLMPITQAGNCRMGSLLVSSTAWTNGNPFAMTAYLCSASYSQAKVRATVSITNNGTSISVNRVDFLTNVEPIDTRALNITSLEENFYSPYWSRKVPLVAALGVDVLPEYIGPVRALALNPRYRNSANALLDDSTFLDGARMLLQHYMGQMMLASLDQTEVSLDADATGQVLVVQRRIAAVSGVGFTIGVLLMLSGIGISLVAWHTRLSRRPLGLRHEPASIAATASLLLKDDHATRLAFEDFDRCSNDVIVDRLQHSRFCLQDGQLLVEYKSVTSHISNDKVPDGNGLPPHITEVRPWGEWPREVGQKSRPLALRDWSGPSLTLLVVIIIAALVTLYVVAGRGGLQQEVITYQINVKISTLAASLAPYSIIPTLAAVGVKLWFGGMEESVKRLMPMMTMLDPLQHAASPLLVEYANAPIVFSSFKAFRSQHFIVMLVGLAALGTEVLTVSMSALWTKEIRSHPAIVRLDQQSEIRSVPFVFQTRSSGPGVHQDPVKPNILGSLYGNGLSSWLYSAVIEMTQSGATPAWSKDTWSFAPVDLNTYQGTSVARSSVALSRQKQASNITVRTSAIRARLECHAIPYISNTSLWMRTYDFSSSPLNDSDRRPFFNSTNRPAGLVTAYDLLPTLYAPDSSWLTEAPLGPSVGTLLCCSNITSGVPGEAAIGYWNQLSTAYTSNRMLAKWIVGHPLEGLYNDTRQKYISGPSNVYQYRHWLWAQQPRLQAINCTAHIEQANASVTVDASNGMVWNYTILDGPRTADQAWSDPYVKHAQSSSYKGPFPSNSSYPDLNTTASFGYLFFDSLLNAASIHQLGNENVFSYMAQDDNDHAFNFRDRGLNVDFMSYAMLSLVDGDKPALLDSAVLTEKANTVFGTFFKHFASKGVDPVRGGYVWQKVGERPPLDLGVALSGLPSSHDLSVDIVPHTVEALLDVPTSTLIMSPVAVFICVGLLTYLAINVIIIFGFWVKRIDVLPRDMENLASMLGLVYDSERLLEWVAARKEADDWGTKRIGG